MDRRRARLTVATVLAATVSVNASAFAQFEADRESAASVLRFRETFKRSDERYPCAVDMQRNLIITTIMDQRVPGYVGAWLDDLCVMPDKLVEHACSRVMEKLEHEKLSFSAGWHIFQEVADTPPRAGEWICNLATGEGFKP